MMEPVFAVSIDLEGQSGGLAHALQAQLRQAIVAGRLPAGTSLPSTRRAAAALGIGRNTVIAAYERLVAEGYVIARPGAAPEVALQRHAAGHQNRIAAADAAHRLAMQWRNSAPEGASATPAAVRSFRTGMPDARYFPHARWRQLMQRSLRDWARRPFAYPPHQGLPALREAIAGHVAFTRGVACHADDVIVTSGAAQAFDLLARVFVEAGRTQVAVESPGYPPLAHAFSAAGAELVPVAVDGEGLCVDQLPGGVGVVCVTPSHQSPLGVLLSQARRRALLEHAEHANAIVVEDDYDGEFRYGGRSLDALQTLDRSGRVFYVGTFSKSMFPSLRIGFLIAPDWARDGLVAARQVSDPHGNDVTQMALAAFIEEGELARHVRRMQRRYAERRKAILAALDGPLARWLVPVPSEAGLHLAAQLVDPADERRMLATAIRHLPGITTIASYAQDAAVSPGFVFGFGCIDAEEATDCMDAFARALMGRSIPR